MDRYWLLTWTTYGTWLPGDERGSVRPPRNAFGTPVEPPAPELARVIRATMKGPATYLTAAQAKAIVAQMHETAAARGWELHAMAVMRNHVHLVVGVPGDPSADALLRDVKAYASRALNRLAARERWWTKSGSRRKLPNEAAVVGAVRYVERQQRPLVVWIAEQWRQEK